MDTMRNCVINKVITYQGRFESFDFSYALHHIPRNHRPVRTTETKHKPRSGVSTIIMSDEAVVATILSIIKKT